MEKLTPQQQHLVSVLDEAYNAVKGDRRLFSMALVQSKMATSEREANKIIDGYLKIKNLCKH